MVGVVLVLALGWVAWQAVHVRRDQARLREQVGVLRVAAARGDYTRARGLLAQIRTQVDDADRRTSDPVWTVLAAVPWAGRDLAAVHAGTDAAAGLARTVLPEVEQLTELVQDRPLVRSGAVQLGVLRSFAPLVDRAASASAELRARLARAPQGHLSPVRRGLRGLCDQVAELDGSLQTARRALTVLPAMLGADGPRRYFVAVQNPAEARATGGLIGAYALVTADRGRLTLVRAGSDSDFRQGERPIDLPPDAAAIWEREGSAQYWFNANLTPHFPDTARTISGLWAAQGGGPLDGVLTLDPLAMSELLRATGPVSLPAGLRIGSEGVADFVMHGEYVRFGSGDQTARKQVLSALAGAIFRRLVASPRPTETLRAVLAAAGSGHVQVWSQRPTEQAVLASGRVGGALPSGRAPFLEVLTQNYGGDKLDYYVRRTVSVTTDGTGRQRVVLQLRSVVPGGLPTYMTGRNDKPDPPVPVGQAKIGIAVYGAVGSLFDDVQVDGRPSTMTFDHDHGHGLGSLVLELPPGGTRTVAVTVTQPPGVLTYRQQPLAYPDTLRIDLPHRVVGR